MKPESISEKLMFNTVRLETELGMGTGFFYNFKVGENIYPTIITNKHVVNHKQDENVTQLFQLAIIEEECYGNTNQSYSPAGSTTLGADPIKKRRLIEKVTVYDERFEVEFKSGTKMDVEK